MPRSAMDRKQRVKILLVDDQPAKLMSYEVILAPLDEHLVKASSGAEALRLLLTTDFAVVVMDVCMPELDGFELARMIREHPRLEKTSIILVSAVFMSDIDRLRGYHSGAVDYMPVPIIPEVLRAKVSVFVDLYRKTEQLRGLNLELEERVSHRTQDLAATTASLEKSEERFRFLAENIASMLWISALDGTITYANRRWLEYRGLTELPSGSQWPDIEVHADDRERWLAEWRAHLDTGERFDIEARHRRYDGTYRWFLTRAAPRLGDDGEMICWFGVTTDIHDQKTMHQQLRDADRRKDEFLAVLSHELRNPLSPIRNAVQVMRLAGAENPQIVWCRDVIERQTEHLTRLVDDLLDVSRITRGKVRLQKETIDLGAVVASAVETNRQLIEAKKHVVSIETPETPVLVSGDPMRIGQVFANLINNAAKYMEVGGSIVVQVARDASDPFLATVRVRDTGYGIPAAVLPIVFEMFTQGDRTISDAQGGLGVGLSLVRSLVGLHGGTVEAHSDGAGRGSEFLVRLPALDRDGVRMPPPSSQLGAPRRSDAARVVLVVDDNQDSADSLAILLRTLGHEVHTASDGLAAIDGAERLRPDVVLLDLGMPRCDGYEAAKAIRQKPWGRSMVLVAQTGWGQEEDRKRTASAGFDLHMTKPIDIGALLRLIDSLPLSRVEVR